MLGRTAGSSHNDLPDDPPALSVGREVVFVLRIVKLPTTHRSTRGRGRRHLVAVVLMLLLLLRGRLLHHHGVPARLTHVGVGQPAHVPVQVV